jgi:hypothetical protein
MSTLESSAPEFADEQEIFGTKGIRANGNKLFAIPLYGSEIYALRSFLEEQARLNTEDYATVRKCVLLAETLRVRAKEQGF